MNILRPYNAEDNDTNKYQVRLLMNYCKKIGETIETLEIYGLTVVAHTSTGRKYIASQSQTQRPMNFKANFIYVNVEENGKRKRVPRDQW